MDDDLPMGSYVMLRANNFEKVSQIAGYSLEDLGTIFERANARGLDKVKLPIVPLEYRNH
jgi:hypothetical protein